MVRILRQNWILAAASWLLGGYLRLTLASQRWRIEGDAHLDGVRAGQPLVVAVWHDQLALLPWLAVWLRRQGVTLRPRLLVSRHQDGQILAGVMRRFGTVAVHGSSRDHKARERGGAAAVRRLVEVMAAGESIVVTPDGPRGPAHQAAAGLAQIAALAGAPILPVGCRASHRWLLPTWDRMVLPLPFGRAVIAIGPPLAVPRTGWRDAMPGAQAAIDAASARAAELLDGA